jgi:hypothetical protein
MGSQLENPSNPLESAAISFRPPKGFTGAQKSQVICRKGRLQWSLAKDAIIAKLQSLLE